MTISNEEIRTELERVLASSSFAKSPRMTEFLSYLVNANLNGDSDRLKGYTIGIDVFERPMDFDPQLDSIVRVQAGRLRKALKTYYLTDGKENDVRLGLPNGSYVPVFEREAREGLASVETSPELAQLNELFAQIWRKMNAAVIMSALTCLTVLIVAGLLLFNQRDYPKTDFPTALKFPMGPSITVYPFVTVDVSEESPNKERANVLKIGFQDDLLSKLSLFKDLKVVRFNRSYLDEGKSEFLVNTDYKLEGSIQVFRDSIRISSHLESVENGSIIWSKEFKEPLRTSEGASAAGILKIQSAIASDVATSLGQPYSVINKYLEKQQAKSNDRDLSHHFCLIKHYTYSRGKSAALHKEVRDCLEMSVKASPDFSSGWAALSWIYGDEARNNYNREGSRLDSRLKALAAAEKAVEADVDNAIAYEYLAIAKFELGNHQGFRESAERALKLNPNDPEILANVGNYLLLLGDTEQGKRMIEKAIDLNPGGPAWYHGWLVFHYYAREEAKHTLYHARRYSKDNGVASRAMLVASFVQDKQISEAERAYQLLIDEYPDFEVNYSETIQSWGLSTQLIMRIIKDLTSAGLPAD